MAAEPPARHEQQQSRQAPHDAAPADMPAAEAAAASSSAAAAADFDAYCDAFVSCHCDTAGELAALLHGGAFGATDDLRLGFHFDDAEEQALLSHAIIGPGGGDVERGGGGGGGSGGRASGGGSGGEATLLDRLHGFGLRAPPAAAVAGSAGGLPRKCTAAEVTTFAACLHAATVPRIQAWLWTQ